MSVLERKYAHHLYIPWLISLVDFGDAVTVRGHKTKELLNCVSVIEQPEHHCILIPSRRWNPWLAMSEALWILSGRNDVASIEPYNKNIVNYSDDGSTLYGAYGHRIYYQIDEVIERLRLDPSDRRAVISIWDKDDLSQETKDPPCNNLLYFKLRDRKLHMTVICRSNDLHYGLFAVNIPTFGILQEYIAARLGVDLGTQTHFSNSLHVYLDDKNAANITRRMMYDETDDVVRYPNHHRMFHPADFTEIKNHHQFAQICGSVLDGKDVISTKRFPMFLNFAARFLKQYKNREIDPTVASTFPEFGDWNLAANIFAQRVWTKSFAKST